MTSNGRRIDDPDYQITLYFELLEDVYLDWSENGDGTVSEASSVASSSSEDFPEEEEGEFQRIQGDAAAETAVVQLEKKENHPLIIMVREFDQISRIDITR